MNQGGVAVMLVGETQDKNKTQEVVSDAMNHRSWMSTTAAPPVGSSTSRAARTSR